MQQRHPLMTGQPRPSRKLAWGLFVLSLATTLGVSIILQRLVSPVGDAIIAASRDHDRGQTTPLVAKDSRAHLPAAE
jgi:hypothetical protein